MDEGFEGRNARSQESTHLDVDGSRLHVVRSEGEVTRGSR